MHLSQVNVGELFLSLRLLQQHAQDQIGPYVSGTTSAAIIVGGSEGAACGSF